MKNYTPRHKTIVPIDVLEVYKKRQLADSEKMFDFPQILSGRGGGLPAESPD